MATDESHDDRTQSFVNLIADTKVSHYKIIEKIGSGGMGDVYLAEDAELHRKVALKFLPLHLCEGEASRARFTREARAAAKLDHPNIVPVYEVGEFNGRPFFAMAHIEGKSLRDIIKEGKLSVRDAINATIQICEGLRKAHESGVVHRDVKPGNIIIDNENRPRILDFGLATVSGEEKLTKTGSTLGTVGYTSPEQVQGGLVDHRSDLFSVGVVLYEMVTGRTPFEAEHEAAIHYNIVHEDPEPLARYKSGVTGELQQIIDKALSKDVSTRYQHADGMVADLKRLVQRPSDSRAGAAVLGPRSRIGMTFGLAAVALAVFTIIVLLINRDEPLTFQPPRYTKLTSTGDIRLCELSPDGEFYAYARRTDDRKFKFYVADIAGGKPLKVFECESYYGLWWSPDGSELLIQVPEEENEWAYLVPRLGGSPRRCRVPDRNTCWTADANKIVSVQGSEGRLFFVDTRSRDTSYVLVEGLEAVNEIYGCSPDGKWLLVSSWTGGEGYQLLVVSVDGSVIRPVFVGLFTGAAWGAEGAYIYARVWGLDNQEMLRIVFNSETGETMGEPVTISTELGQGQFSVSTDGRRMLCRRGFESCDLWRIELDAEGDPAESEMTRLTRTTLVNFHPSISPDGERLAFSSLNEVGTDLFVMSAGGGEREQLTFSNLINVDPAWSPDGTQLTYFSVKERDAKEATWSFVDLSDGSVRQFPFIFDSTINNCPGPLTIEWCPGDLVAVSACQIMFIDPVTGERVTVSGMPTEGEISSGHYAPDGSSLAVRWNQEGEWSDGIWIIPLDNEPVRFVGDIDANAEIIGWSPDAGWVYYWQKSDSGAYEIKRVMIESGGVQVQAVLTLAPQQSISGMDLSPDASWIVCSIRESPLDLWLVENFDPYVE